MVNILQGSLAVCSFPRVAQSFSSVLDSSASSAASSDCAGAKHRAGAQSAEEGGLLGFCLLGSSVLSDLCDGLFYVCFLCLLPKSASLVCFPRLLLLFSVVCEGLRALLAMSTLLAARMQSPAILTTTDA